MADNIRVRRRWEKIGKWLTYLFGGLLVGGIVLFALYYFSNGTYWGIVPKQSSDTVAVLKSKKAKHYGKAEHKKAAAPLIERSKDDEIAFLKEKNRTQAKSIVLLGKPRLGNCVAVDTARIQRMAVEKYKRTLLHRHKHTALSHKKRHKKKACFCLIPLRHRLASRY